MRISYLDCFSGISGDMFLGALVDAGVSPKLLEETVAALDVGARLEISSVVRGGVAATKGDVYAHGEKDLPREVFWERQGSGDSHDHSHGHSHAHSHRQDNSSIGTQQHEHDQRRTRAGGPGPPDHAHSPGR